MKMKEKDVDKHICIMLTLWAQLQGKCEERARGQGFVEYAFILVFVSVAIIAALGLLAGGLSTLFSDIAVCLGTPSVANCFP
jgi:Flp pilus assembly pilin Flp